MKLAEISPLVGLSISWISEILRGTNAETGQRTNAKKEYQIKADEYNEDRKQTASGTVRAGGVR